MTVRGRAAGNLPAPLTRFVGRRNDIAQIRRLLGQSRLVTLVGVGGVGKTRLAMEIAREFGKAFRHGAWFVDFAAVNDQAQLAQTIATALQVPNQSTRPAEEQIMQYLSGREQLVVLDNCEHVLDGAAILAENLLEAAPALRLLVTSREALGVPGEHIAGVQPLSNPNPDSIPPPAALESFEAAALFLDRARAVLPDFQATEANTAHIVRLCTELDGLPLAIELAASRLRSLEVAQIVERLADRFALLTSGSRTARSRQRTLRALISWSYDLCSREQQLLWQRLSVFVGSFDLAAVEGVCSDAKLPVAGLLDLLDSLVAQSVVLVERRGSSGSSHYRMLETIRAFGLGMLEHNGICEDLRGRHCAYYLKLAEWEAETWAGRLQAEGLEALRLSHTNLRAALEWAVAHSAQDSGTTAHRLVTALRFHWCMDGFLSEGRRWLDRILQIFPTEEQIYGRTLWVAGWAAVVQGDRQIAIDRLAAAERIAEATADEVLAAQVHGMQGTVALFSGVLDTAVRLHEDAVQRFITLGNEGEALFAMFQLAVTLAQGGSPRAESTARAAVELATRRGEKLCRSYALWALGYAAWRKEDWTAASEFARAGLAIHREYNDPVGSSLLIELLAWIAASEGSSERAGRLLGAVHVQWQRIGSAISYFGPHFASDHARGERRVVEVVHAERWQALMTEGGQWDLQRALSEAIGQHSVVAAAGASRHGGKSSLTPREREVADLIADGLSNRAIATTLIVSPRTVDGHVENILAKLGFTSRTQVAAWVAGRSASKNQSD